MTRINTTTNHGVYTREEVSPLGNDKQADATNLHGSGDGLDSQPSGTGGAADAPSTSSSFEKSKAFIDEVRRLLGRGGAGIQQLYSQLQYGELPFKPEEISLKEILYIATELLDEPFGTKIFELLVSGENPRIDLGRLSREDSNILANKLRRRDSTWVKCLANLINDDRLSNFTTDGWPRTDLDLLIFKGPDAMDLLGTLIRKDKVPGFTYKAPKEFIDFCFSQEASGISLLQVSLDKGIISNLDPSKFSQEETKAFVYKLLEHGPSGELIVENLVKQRKLSHFKSLKEIFSKAALDAAMAMLERSNPNVEYFKWQVSGGNPRIDLGRLSRKDSYLLANKLRRRDSTWVKCLADLIDDDRLPNFSLDGWPRTYLNSFIHELLYGGPAAMDLLGALIGKNKVSNFAIEASEEFVDFCFSKGPSGISLLQVFLDKGMISNLDPSKFSWEETKAFTDKLSKYGRLGRDLLAKLVEQGKLPHLESESLEEIFSKAALDAAMAVLKDNNLDMEIFKRQVSGENPGIDLGLLSREDSYILVDELLEWGSMGTKCLTDLINDDRLPNFITDRWLRTYLNSLIYGTPADRYLLRALIGKNKVSNFAIEASEKFIDFCFSREASGVSLLQVFLDKGIIDPSKFSREKTRAFANGLLKHDQSGRDLVAKLIKQGKLPHFKSLREIFSKNTLDAAMAVLKDNNPDVEIFKRQVSGENPRIDLKCLSRKDSDILADELRKCGPMGTKCLDDLINDSRLLHFRKDRDWELSPDQILNNGISKAFFGKTDGIDDESWTNVFTRLWDMPLEEACGIWQRIANEVAADCCDGDGHVDVERVGRWTGLLGNAETFKKNPYCLIPHAELIRSQMHRVCECLVLNINGARDQLDATIDIIPGTYGQDILKTMSRGREQLLRFGEAILASLLAPYRQKDLPTCTIYSSINAEIRNHPERLIKMYIQMLRDGQFTFPSGYAAQLQPMEDGFITVDLINGGGGRKQVFWHIMDGDRAEIDQQIKDWQLEGIEYVESADETEKYKLKMPIHNMNDLLFVHFFLASNFGNGKIDNDSTFGTMLIYAGHNEFNKMFPQKIIQVDGSSFLFGMTQLKKQAEAQRQLGYHYMRVSTSGHAENLDIAALLALDLDNMEPGKAYPIGDRNFGDRNMTQDIPRLAIRKVDGTPPTYEFGVLWRSSFPKNDIFQKENIFSFNIYATDIEVHDA